MNGIDTISNIRMLHQNQNRKSIIEGEDGRVSFNDALKKTMEHAPSDTGVPPAEKRHKAADKKLMDACLEMESIFVAKMIKEMRKTVHKGEILHGGHAEEIFEDMLYDEYALTLSKNSNLGLANMMYQELSRK